MPASRWNSSILDMLNWLYEQQADLDEFLLKPITPRVILSETEDIEEEEEITLEENNFPQVLPVLPLRGLVVYPFTAVPLTIGQPRSIRLVDDVMAADQRTIVLVASRDPDLETPQPKDLFEIGTIAIIHRMFRTPDGTIRLGGARHFSLQDSGIHSGRTLLNSEY